MTGNGKFDNDAGRVGARMMEGRHKIVSSARKQAMGSSHDTFQICCGEGIARRFSQLQKKLASKNLMFKFDGSKYAIFTLDVEDGTLVTEYKLTLEEAEDFAEKV